MRLISLLLFLFTSLSISAQNANTTIPFYSTKVNLVFSKAATLPKINRIEADQFVAFYKKMESRPYQTLLTSLQSQQILLNLNDWYFFELIHKTVNKTYVNYNRSQKDLFIWFLLNKAGFDSRIAHINSSVYVYVYSKDAIFECPMFKENGRTYINLTSLLHRKEEKVNSLYTPDFKPNPRGKSFSFDLKKTPSFPSKIGKKTIFFNYEEKRIELKVQYDAALVERMKKYPFVAEAAYIEKGLSDILKRSLIAQVKYQIRGLSQEQSIAYLLALTRSGFQYKEDEDFFGYSKPMIAEELFAYPYSDCEDRSALFFNLSKEILGLPMLVITYPDHVSIGVATSKTIGKALRYRGKKYTICDPTGPSNSCSLGVYPPGYERKKFQVIATF